MIIDAIHTAYDQMVKRNWDTIYWAIDLHGVCLKSTYKSGAHEFISEDAVKALQMISNRKESKIIIWTSTHENDYPAIRKLFDDNGIRIDYFNENPEVESTAISSFVSKFYFSVLLDDKAGFVPENDWPKIIKFFDVKSRHEAAAPWLV